MPEEYPEADYYAELPPSQGLLSYIFTHFPWAFGRIDEGSTILSMAINNERCMRMAKGTYGIATAARCGLRHP